MAVCKADRRLYQTRDKKRVVEEGDPDAAFLFCSAGQELSETDLSAYGLEVRDEALVLPAKSSKARQKTEDKAAAKGDDKSVKKTEGKSSRKS